MRRGKYKTSTPISGTSGHNSGVTGWAEDAGDKEKSECGFLMSRKKSISVSFLDRVAKLANVLSQWLRARSFAHRTMAFAPLEPLAGPGQRVYLDFGDTKGPWSMAS
jgi:hypothetical protein